jgi:hypothetical protein
VVSGNEAWTAAGRVAGAAESWKCTEEEVVTAAGMEAMPETDRDHWQSGIRNDSEPERQATCRRLHFRGSEQ